VNLFSAAERLAAIDRSQVQLNNQQCLHALDSQANCQVCTLICPEQAVQIGPPPVFDIQRCDNCLACVPACPVGAFRADDVHQSLLNCATRADGAALELNCSLHPHPGSGLPESLGIQVRGCLAGLGAGSLLSLAALDIGRVILRTDACTDCPKSSLIPWIKRNLASVKTLLDAFGSNLSIEHSDTRDSMELVERPLWQADNPPLSRRDLFRIASRQGKIAAARAMIHDSESSAHRLPRERQRVMKALDHLMGEIDIHRSNARIEGFGLVSISKECTACQACAKVCPSGALMYQEEE
jgi:ferredoxin